MGKSRNGIHGNWWGRTGNIVARRSQNRTLYSIYQPLVENPKTVAQQSQRQKFGLLAAFAGKVGPWLKETFNTLDGYKTGVPYSAFIGFNLKNGNVITGTYPNQAINFENLSVSYGNVPLPTGIAAEASDHTVGVTWTDNSGEMGAETTDIAWVLVYSVEKKRAVARMANDTRGTRRCDVPYSNSWEGDTLQAYLVMLRPDKSDFSETYYLGDFEG